MQRRPPALNLSNWRQSPYSQWSFHHVREVIPTEPVLARRGATSEWQTDKRPLDSLEFEGRAGERWSLQQLYQATSTDALLVAQQGKLVHEWFAHDAIEQLPHIVFSVSKSITATLAGVLVEQGLLDPGKPVLDYLPGLGESR